MNKPFAKKTTIIILIALALLAVLLSCGIFVLSKYGEVKWDYTFLKQNPKPIVYEELKTEMDTSDWIVYDNKEYGFSFKYPRDWEVQRTLGGVSLTPLSCPDVIRDDGKKSGAFAIVINQSYNISDIIPPEGKYSTLKEVKKDVYYKMNDYLFHKIYWIGDKGRKGVVMIVRDEKSGKILETGNSNECISVVDEPKFLDAILTTLKIYD